MLLPILNQTGALALEKYAAFAEKRHEVLVGNIANVDTPGYRTRDLPVEDFQQAMQAMLAAKHQSSTQLTATGFKPLGASSTTTISPKLFHARELESESVTAHDGNNRSIEREITTLTKNQLKQQYAISMLSQQMALLESVIQDGRR